MVRTFFFIARDFMLNQFSKKQLKKQLLVQTVLASSIFVAPIVYVRTVDASTDILKKTNPNALSSCVINETRYEHIKTSSCVDNTVSVGSQGQIINVAEDLNIDPIFLDQDGGRIIIEPGNVHGSKAVLVAQHDLYYQRRNAINITGKKGIVTIGKGSGVTSEQDHVNSDVIYINNGDVTISNAGVIKANPVSANIGVNGGAIYMGPLGINATVNNFSGAEISNNWYASNAVITAGNGFSLINNGLIQSNANPAGMADALFLKDFKFVINSGRIISSTATAINIDGEKIGGSKKDIAIHNKPGGEIRAINGSAIEGGWAIMGTADGVPSILNQGIISSGSGITVQGTELLGGLVNEGMIINEAGNTAIALNWIARSGRGSPFIQKKGEVQGHVYLSPADGYGRGSVFTLSGGTITGNVTAADNQAYSYELSGGELNGTLTGSTRGDIFNQSGSIIKSYQGNAARGNKDTFNITGGSFKALNTNAIGTTDINFNANYTLDGTIVSKGSQLNISVNKSAIVKVSATPVFDLSAGTGAFSNKGTLELGSNGILNINAGGTPEVFRNEAGSYLNIDIDGDQYGQIKVNSKVGEAVLLSDLSFIKPQVKGELTETAFNIITVTGGGTINDAGADVINGSDLFFSTRLLEGNTVLQLFTSGGPSPSDCTVNVHKVDLLRTSSCPDSRIIVQATGQIQNKETASEVLSIDNDDGKVVIEPDNSQYGARSVLATHNSTGTSTIGIHITDQAKKGEITIGAGSGITAESNIANSQAILVDNIGATINNAGFITVNPSSSTCASAIFLNGKDHAVNNLSGGEISGNENVTHYVIHADSGLTLANDGLIQSNSGAWAISIGDFKSITNSGKILNTASDIAIGVNGNGGDDKTIAIHNKPGGIISSVGNYAIVTGLFQLGMAGNTPSLLNEGTISNNSSDYPAIMATELLGGLVNKGDIINKANGTAIYLPYDNPSKKGSPFIQSSGSVQGNVYLSSADGYGQGNIFILAGGTITGNVTAANVSDRTTYIHRLSGGELVGTLRGSWWGDTFNQSGGNIETYEGGAESGNTDTFNITGGSFGTLKATTNKTIPNTTAVNFNGTVTSGAIVGSEGNTLNINVNSGAHVTTNAAISGLSGALKIFEDGSLEPNASITTIGAGRIDNQGLIKVSATPVFDLSTGTGAFNNEGILELGSSAILNINGGGTADVFRNEAGSYLNIDINGDQYGQIKVNSKVGEAVLLSDLSFIKPQVKDELTGTAFNIITVTGGGTINDAGAKVISDGGFSFATKLIEDNTILQLFTSGGPSPSDCTVNAHKVDLLQTSLCSDSRIIVQATGQIQNKETGSEVLSIDNNGGKIIVDSDNAQYGARSVLATRNLTGTPTIGIHITDQAKKGEVTIGAGSGITAESNIANSHGIVIEGADTTITNAGLIQLNSPDPNTKASAIYIAATGSATLNNSGEILNNNKYITPLIVAEVGAQLLGDLTNTGKIINKTSGGIAIDLSQATKGVFIQKGKGAEVQGDVFLAQGDDFGRRNVFTLEDGIITGNIHGANAQPYTYELRGGKVIGTFTGGTKGDTFNQYGKNQVSIFQGNAGVDRQDIFHIEAASGSFGTLKTSTTKGATTEVNFSTNYALNGSIAGSEGNTLYINIGRRQEVTNANFTANAPISGLSGDLTVFSDSVFVPKSTITTHDTGRVVNQGLMKVSEAKALFDLSSGGTFSNLGRLELGEEGVLRIKAGTGGNAFTNENEGSLFININDDSYGQIKVETKGEGEAVVLKNKSIIQPVLKGNPQDTTFDIITVTGGGTISDEGVQVKNDDQYHFEGKLSEDSKTFQLFMTPNFYRSPSLDEVMQTLMPNHNGLIQSAKQGMNEVFDVVSDRIFGVAQGSQYRDEINQGGVWLRALGSHAAQGIREGVSGYKAEGVGFALGTDFVYNDENTLGFAVNYYKTNVDGENQLSAQDGNILNLQATLYGSIHFEHGIFLNAIAGGSANDYQSNHVIAANDFSTIARGTFGGMQWGGQVDLGMAMVDSGDDFIAPFVSVKSMFLSFDNYTETGAGDLGLSINNSHVSELMAGVGLKLSTVWQLGKIAYAPALTALVGYDFVNDRQSLTAHFISGGPAFSSFGVTSAPMLFDLGLGLNVLSDKEMVFSVKYDMGVRDKFLSHAGYVQYSYQWS